ncbi:hypothetical protein C8R43DRAFT_1118274 [Mycena crocata]|nr:hypothetical protein C8R43DRAFT_1118274 [Mycena crocata]
MSTPPLALHHINGVTDLVERTRLDLTLYKRQPDEYTITTHDEYNLPSFGLIINVQFGLFICISCETAIAPGELETHIHLHVPALPIPSTMVENLTLEFDIGAIEEILPPRDSPMPIFGLRLTDHIYFFCARCGRGYIDYYTLRSHQNNAKRCPRPPHAGNEFRVGYAQQFTLGAHRSIFQVRPSLLPETTADDPTPAKIFRQTFPPPPDYSDIPFAKPQRQLDLSSFALREGWLDHVEGYTPAELAEACRNSQDDDELHHIKPLVVGYISGIQPTIAEYEGFGMQRLMAHVGLTESLAGFNTVQQPTCDKYGRILWCLLFNLLRQYRGELEEATPYSYPINDVQHSRLRSLNSAIEHQSTNEVLERHIHTLIQSLFCQTKAKNTEGKYFAAVNCYVVLIGHHPSGHIRPASTITSFIAALIYANRTTQMRQMKEFQTQDPLLTAYAAYDKVKIWLQDMQETPMAYLWNVQALLRTISADEYTDAGATFTDGTFRVLSYLGKEIHLSKLGELLKVLEDRYRDGVRDLLFFGEEMPDNLLLHISTRHIADNPHNRALGFSFLEHPDNGFADLVTEYGEFILSDPDRAAQYTYIQDGKLVWRPLPCLKLLGNMDTLSDLLILRCVFGAGGSGRATDVAAQTLRNKPGCSIRNTQFLYHVLTLIGIQDKTSHKRLKDRFIPHAPPPSVADDLIYSLAIFRPFQAFLALQFLGATESQRFHEYLWPRLQKNLPSERLSAMMGDWTEKIVDCRLTMTNYRKVVATFSQRLGDPLAFETSKHYFWDQQADHSSSTANTIYQQDRIHVPGISPEHVVGCITQCITWHRLIGIDQDRPLTVTAVGMDAALDHAASALHGPQDDSDQPLAAVDAKAIAATVVFRPSVQVTGDSRP